MAKRKRLDAVLDHAAEEAQRILKAEQRRAREAELAPLMATRRERTHAFLVDKAAIAELLVYLADGGSLRRFCESHVYAYGAVQSTLTKREDLLPLYDAALEARSDLQREQIEQLIRRVERGEIDPKAGAVALAGRQWLAEKMNPRRYGQRQQVDVQVTDMTKLHLEAVKALASKPRLAAIEAVQVRPGEFSVPALVSEAPAE